MPQSAFPLSVALLILFAGFSFVMQQALNADLRSTIGSASWTGFVSYLGGTLCMLVLALALHDAMPNSQQLMKTHWWAWSGGFFGAVYIGISILFLPRIGAAAFIALLVAGQMLTSLAFDHFGLFGAPQLSVSLYRLLGAALIVGGVILIRH